ncbi:hypothetical protein, partial [Collinsella tanakaei]|uniref:hypothetical protein n=1 Tax=Collinsella tanakaei TaxID=626935 RepID=UPI003AB77CCA
SMRRPRISRPRSSGGIAMQPSEYIQIACAIVGLAGITLARVRFTRRQQANPGVTSYSDGERKIYYASWAVIAAALVLVFFPF